MTETTAASPPELAKTQAARAALDLRMIPISEIAADPDQPRKTFDAAKLDELGASLKQGQTNAIKVRPRRADEDFPPEVKWVLMHGERRLRAAVKAEIPQLRAEVGWSVAAGDEALVLLDQIADNLHSLDLGAVEEAAGIRRYAELAKLGTRAVAAKLGKNQMYVSHALAMRDLPANLLEKIEQNERTEDAEVAPLTWRHLRQLLRLKDHPDVLEAVYDDAIADRSTSRDLEIMVDEELGAIENQRKLAERRAAATKRAAEGGKPTEATTAPVPPPLSALDEKAKRDRLNKARMTRARKDVIRGMLPDVVHQVARIANGIRLPEGLAQIAADKVRGHDAWQICQRVAASGTGPQFTGYGEDLAQLVVPELPGEWTGWAGRGGTSLGVALNSGSLARDDEAGRHWLAFVYWLATETKGLDKGLDKAAADILKDRHVRTAQAAKKTLGMGGLMKTAPTRAAKAAPTWSRDLICARDDCKQVFHVKQGQPGRRPKYCPEHRSK